MLTSAQKATKTPMFNNIMQTYTASNPLTIQNGELVHITSSTTDGAYFQYSVFSSTTTPFEVSGGEGLVVFFLLIICLLIMFGGIFNRFIGIKIKRNI